MSSNSGTKPTNGTGDTNNSSNNDRQHASKPRSNQNRRTAGTKGGRGSGGTTSSSTGSNGSVTSKKPSQGQGGRSRPNRGSGRKKQDGEKQQGPPGESAAKKQKGKKTASDDHESGVVCAQPNSVDSSAGSQSSIKKRSRPRSKRNLARKKSEEQIEAERVSLAEQEEAKRKLQMEMEKKEKIRLEEEEQARQEAIRLEEKLALEEKVMATCKVLLDNIVQVTNSHKNTRLQVDQLMQHRSDFQVQKKTLKSDLKKCTAFCKKIKSTQNWDLPSPATPSPTIVTSMLNDIEKLNLSRYTEEIAAAFLEAKLKVADVPGVVAVCVALHLRYNDFMDILLPTLFAVFKGLSSPSKSTPEDAKQKRIYLRILTEFTIVGILTDFKPILKIISEAAGAPSSSNSNGKYNVTDAILVVSFAKASGHEIIGITPKSVKGRLTLLGDEVDKCVEEKLYDDPTAPSIYDDSEEKVSDLSTDKTHVNDFSGIGTNNKSAEKGVNSQYEQDYVCKLSPDLVILAKDAIKKTQDAIQVRSASDEVSKKFRKHLLGAYSSLSASYVLTHMKLLKLEKRCEQDRLLAGSLTEQREKGLSDARKLLETMKKSVEALAEALDMKVPVLAAEDESTESANESAGLELYKGEDGRDANLGPFDDEETRAFYCDIPDLLTTIPAALLGHSAEDVERIQAVNTKKYGSGFDSVAEESDSGILPGDGNTPEESASFSADLQEEADVGTADDGDDDVENKDTPHYKLTLLIDQELPESNRRDKIDQLAEKFCVNHGASKNSRKRLQRALFLVPRSRLDLLPYYSRISAVFDRVFPDIAAPLVTDLEQQFHGLARWKKQQSVENRLRNARYIGELTKFRVAPPIVVLRCLRRCLDDFSGYNVDVACCLLESCGRYLHRTKHTSAKLANLMDTMARIRKARNFDERTIALINSAFYMVIPPQTGNRQHSKILTPLEAYTQDLLLVRLIPDQRMIAFVSKQLLRFPWTDPSIECSVLVVKYLLKACRKGRYKSISAVAAVISNLKKSKPEILAQVTDAVVEELQFAMENPRIHVQQRTIVYAKLLGELHSHALLAASIVFEQLYRLIDFGHDIPDVLRQISLASLSPTPPALGGPLGVTQTIKEDEEMEEGDEKSQEVEEQKPSAISVSPHSKYDPRVPCAFDPPSAVFRIKLVCTLLDSCASSLVTCANNTKLEKFLISLQRYLFTKFTLPTDVEFSVLDTYDLLDSKLKLLGNDGKKSISIIRCKTWLEAHTATVDVEEVEELTEGKALKRLLTQAGLAITAGGDGDAGNDDLEVGGIGYEEADDSTADAISLNSHENYSLDDGSESSKESDDDSTNHASEDPSSSGDEVEDTDENSEDDDDEDDYPTDDDDDISEAAAEERRTQKLEEEAFERELRRLTMDALEKGKVAARTGASAKVSDTMPSASQFVRRKGPGLNIGGELQTGSLMALGGEAGVSFKLLKRGHKGRVEAKNLVVPSVTNLAKMATKQDDEAAKERDMLKARVLRYEAESAEQLYSGNVYMDQTKLPEVRNRPLLMEDIDRNFGNTGGDYRGRLTASGGRGGRGGGRLFDTGRGRAGYSHK